MTAMTSPHIDEHRSAKPGGVEEAVERENAALLEENAALTKALTGLTCGGSEFFNRKGDRYVADIDACVAWVRRRDTDAFRRARDAMLARKAAEAREAKLLDALRERTEALRPLARLEVPKRPQGNAGAYSILHDHIRAAQKALTDAGRA